MPTVKELKDQIMGKWSKIQDAQVRHLIDQLIQHAESLEQSNKKLQSPGNKPNHIRPRGNDLELIQSELDLDLLSDEKTAGEEPSLRQMVTHLIDHTKNLEVTFEQLIQK
ncbi:hypothetical protein [Haliscomenobacter hydrossis]|uniref:Uncharacterized protein n=1 Tax=Haliscomenobacter hydrossis (strain ATCC 27775 / DSM 1100 / LMG 10767 / O) TaxID=760192 RepID=F4KV63_HALH1|nr:hypothetical protein [Haliscomenobacter hydrossis]AEE49229.1 hypothetical protein Halhy_1334 [Haliscomenobacter hydrossis DSM 1100]